MTSYLLVIVTHPPYFTCAYQDALEAVIAASNADIDVRIIFANKGVYQLLAGHNVSVGRKNINKQIALFSLLDIAPLYCFNVPEEAVLQLTQQNDKQIECLSVQKYSDLLKCAMNILVF